MTTWDRRKGQVLPTDTSVTFGNDAVDLNATVFYADLADSTVLVDTHDPKFAAEIYKVFLSAAAKIIHACDGEVTAYDGDRVMAVFLGDSKNTNAVDAALKLRFAIKDLIQPAIDTLYGSLNFELKHVVGIDTSPLLVAKTGIRNYNDLVWVGRAANHAAKMAALPDHFKTYISADVYEQIHESFRVDPKGQVWEAVRWDSFDDRIIYRTNWWAEI